MKKTFLRFGVLAAMISFAFGQSQGQVSNSKFTSASEALNMAINSKNAAGQSSATNQLNQLMNTQIAYLSSKQQASLATEQKAYSTFQQLKGSLVPNKNPINTNLNSFSATLQ